MIHGPSTHTSTAKCHCESPNHSPSYHFIPCCVISSVLVCVGILQEEPAPLRICQHHDGDWLFHLPDILRQRERLPYSGAPVVQPLSHDLEPVHLRVGAAFFIHEAVAGPCLSFFLLLGATFCPRLAHRFFRRLLPNFAGADHSPCTVVGLIGRALSGSDGLGCLARSAVTPLEVAQRKLRLVEALSVLLRFGGVVLLFGELDERCAGCRQGLCSRGRDGVLWRGRAVQSLASEESHLRRYFNIQLTYQFLS